MGIADFELLISSKALAIADCRMPIGILLTTSLTGLRDASIDQKTGRQRPIGSRQSAFGSRQQHSAIGNWKSPLC